MRPRRSPAFVAAFDQVEAAGTAMLLALDAMADVDEVIATVLAFGFVDELHSRLLSADEVG